MIDSYVEINLTKLTNNVKTILEKYPDYKSYIAVVKGDGDGNGAAVAVKIIAVVLAVAALAMAAVAVTTVVKRRRKA